MKLVGNKHVHNVLQDPCPTLSKLTKSHKQWVLKDFHYVFSGLVSWTCKCKWVCFCDTKYETPRSTLRG